MNKQGSYATERPPARARERLLAGLPVTELRLELAGVSTAVLVGGDGPPLVLLHGPGEYAAKWMRVIPDLVATRRVVAPDLPGHGTSEVTDGRPLDADRLLAWLGGLVERTCPTPPALVGQILGGAVAARFASNRGDRLSRLVLVDTLGLTAFQPALEFGLALTEFIAEPTEDTHDRLWRRCAFDLDRMRERMGESWEWLKAYNLDRARADPPGQPAQAHGAVRAARDPAGGAGTDRRSHDPDLGAPRPRDAAAGRRGRERPLRMVAARDRGCWRRSAHGTARSVLESAARLPWQPPTT